MTHVSEKLLEIRGTPRGTGRCIFHCFENQWPDLVEGLSLSIDPETVGRERGFVIFRDSRLNDPVGELSLEGAMAYLRQVLGEWRRDPRCHEIEFIFAISARAEQERCLFFCTGPARQMAAANAAVVAPLVNNAGQPLQRFLNQRSKNTPMYRIDDYVNPISGKEVRNRNRALYIQENVRDGVIHGLYDPEDLHRWFGVQDKTTSPLTQKTVRLTLCRLPRYLLDRW
jgi:hypothetical protein